MAYFLGLTISLGQCGHGSLMRLRVLGTPNLIILSNLDTSIDNSCPICPKVSRALKKYPLSLNLNHLDTLSWIYRT